MELLPKPVPDALANYLNVLNETDYLISIATTDTQPITTEAPLDENYLRNEVEQLIDELYLKGQKKLARHVNSKFRAHLRLHFLPKIINIVQL